MCFWRSLRMETAEFSSTSVFFTVRNNFLVGIMNLSHWNFIPLPPISSNMGTKNKAVPSKQQSFTCAGCSRVPSQYFLLQVEQVKYPLFLPPRLFSRPNSIISLKFKIFFKSSTQSSTPAEVWPVVCRMEWWSCQCCRLHFYLFTSAWCFFFFAVAWCCWLMFSLWSTVTASSFFQNCYLVICHPAPVDCPYLTTVNCARLWIILYFCWTVPLICHDNFEFYKLSFSVIPCLPMK